MMVLEEQERPTVWAGWSCGDGGGYGRRSSTFLGDSMTAMVAESEHATIFFLLHLLR
jgi:hypothetical protein